MQIKIRLCLIAGVLVALAIVVILQLPVGPETPGFAEDPRPEQYLGDDFEQFIEDSVEQRSISSEELVTLLDDPRVQTYLQREHDKQVLQDYFSGDESALTDAEIWRLIESIEGEGRVMAYEALALKLAWLERNSESKSEFDTSAQALLQSYREKASLKAENYDPYEKVPGFAEYKEAEKRIVQEVQQMTSFPDGMNRQEYLRKRLQEAREAAYGS